MADSFYDIGGQEVPVGDIPNPDRSFRDAWVWNGSVLTVDLAAAKQIRSEQIAVAAMERRDDLEREVVEKQLKGQDASAEQAELTALKGSPKQAGLDAIQNAASPQALKAIGLADLF